MALSLAALKRCVKSGQRVDVVNYLYPHLSGPRTVDQVQSRGIKTCIGGQEKPIWIAWPKAPLSRIEGTTLHWLDEENKARILFSFTFQFTAE
ncbi:hypothetical protein [Streptomyces sp. UNOC14_S4]|uniref:hypothetical protein n=1 Tax=Streptomyces sp. UNOC14_S4 TaxID=2872340 RepID=UPI001E3870D2|nr:hypothetical protein [Streptomyces sp. UNOC14_S4]MCC3766466.1 hypothetical protein [Streptomyces sp. UNOC14_S4]